MTPENRVYPGTVIAQCYKCDTFMTLWNVPGAATRIVMLICEKCKRELKTANQKAGFKD